MGRERCCRLLLCIAFLFVVLVSIDARVGGGDAKRQVKGVRLTANATASSTAKPSASSTAKPSARTTVKLAARPIGRFRANAIIKSKVKGARLRLGGGDLVPCSHERNKNLVYGVQQRRFRRRGKRQTTPQFQPFRIHVHYDSSVDIQLNPFHRDRLQNTVIPAVKSNIEAALSVIRATSPILLERDCVNNNFEPLVGSVRRCSVQCNAETFCVQARVPEEHLKRCVQCNNNAPDCETIGSDGPGVNNTDYILYVGTDPGGSCTSQGVLAFANICQMEATLDRPIAGSINYCPQAFSENTDEDNIRVGMHEVIHALVPTLQLFDRIMYCATENLREEPEAKAYLIPQGINCAYCAYYQQSTTNGFSPTAYAFFRDENGNPRTPRDENGRPPQDASGEYIVSETTIRTTTYTDWQTRNGPIGHQVQQFVTPNVVEQARIHYNCSTLDGVELENQGGGGTSFSHFEQRILGNEGMTGVVLYNIRFSRVTFGLLEDTGWYKADYSRAESLAWGRNSGCRLPQGSCREWIQTQQQRGTTLAPFCNRLIDFQSPARLGCTTDREIVSVCNLLDYGGTPIPTEYQYFNSGPNFGAAVAPRVGGSLTTPDFCGIHLPIVLLTGTSQMCNRVEDQPQNSNFRAETYGPGSRCIEHGRQWTENGVSPSGSMYGGGCYQYNCSVAAGVEIVVLGQRFHCNCEGEELVLDITDSGSRFQGSLICPSCAQLCHDNSSLCPLQEPTSCYGRETTGVPITQPVTCYQQFSAGTCVNMTGQTTSVDGCCNGLGGIAYRQNLGSCVQCPQTVNCGALTNPANGQVSHPGGTTVGQTATYSCNTGHNLVGSSTRTCQATGQWSGDAPICELVNCDALTDPANGQVSHPGGTTFGQTATYSCNTGYTLVGDSTRTCQATGQWSGDAPICQFGLLLRLEKESYEVAENVGDSDLALLVCANTSSDVLVGFTVTVSVQNGTALAGRDFLLLTNTLNFVPGVGSQRRCACVQILQDVEDDDNEQFRVTINTTSPNINITRNSSAVTIVDDDQGSTGPALTAQGPFMLRWTNNTPRVNGTTVRVDLAIGPSYRSVMCRLFPRRAQDCSSGSITVTGLASRRRMYNFTVEGTTPAGEKVILYRTFRVDPITDCWLHPINDGLTVTGDTVRVQWQATGPSADNRATLFRCTLDGQAENCQPSEGFVKSGLATGNHRLVITPIDPRCTRRKMSRTFQFKIA